MGAGLDLKPNAAVGIVADTGPPVSVIFYFME